VEIPITTEEVEGKGWIAFALEVRAIAQGDTEDEAKAKLVGLFEKYPDLLDEAKGSPLTPRHG
jgi:hypothetical protein